MAPPILKVILSAVDDVTGNARKAGKGLSDFVSSGLNMLKGLAATAAAAALAGFFKSAIKEADDARLGMVRLGQSVANTGGDFSKLKKPLEDAVKSVQKMSTATDDDLRAALTNMITISGDAKGSMANLGLAADLAAFKQISLQEASQLVGKALAGNTKGLRQYGISVKDGADAIEQLRGKVGGYAQNEAKTFSGGITQIKNQFGEFKEAIGEVILENGALGDATGFVAGALGNLAVWVERNEEKLGALVGGVQRFFGALWDIVKTIYEAVQPALGPLFGGLFKVVLFVLDQATAGVRLLGGAFLGAAAVILDAIGAIVEGGGKLLKIFGIEVVENFGKALRTSADNLRTAAERQMSLGVQASKKGFADLFTTKVEHSKKVEVEETAHQGRLTKVATGGAKERDVTEAEIVTARNKMHAESMKILGEAQQKLIKLTKDNRGEWLKSKEELDEYATSLRDRVLVATQYLGAEIERNKKFLEEANELELKRLEKLDEAVGKARTFADGVKDAATDMGVMSENAGEVVGSMLDMAQTIGKLGFNSIGGILGVVGGLASLIGNWASNPAEKARHETMRRNIAALEKNTSALSTTATGRTLSATEQALKAAQAAAAGVRGLVPGAGGIGRVPDYAGKAAAAREAFLQTLLSQGVSRRDALDLLKDLGIEGVESTDARTFLGALGAAGTQLGRFQLGKAGTDFASQKRLVEEKFDVFGVTGAGDKLQALRELGRFSPALAAALGTGDLQTTAGRGAIKSSLQELFLQITSGAFKGREKELGDVGGPALIDFIKQLLGLLGEVGQLPDDVRSSVAGFQRTAASLALFGNPPTSTLPAFIGDTDAETLTGTRPGLAGVGQVIVNVGTIEQHITSLGDPAADGAALAAGLVTAIDREIEERIQTKSFSFGKLFAS